MDCEFTNFTPEQHAKILIVGDGDFSFSMAFVKRYGLKITCSTLETYDVMVKKYPKFSETYEELKVLGNNVMTGVDATNLQESFLGEKFSHIIFNFPHVGGKSNIKKNRMLLDKFFKSGSCFIGDNGKIMVTLCKGQGGTDADKPKREWCNSWQVTAKAANSGLILSTVRRFEGLLLFQQYVATGFRSQNKQFNTQDSLVHTFIKSHPIPSPGDQPSDRKFSKTITDFCDALSKAWDLTYTTHCNSPYERDNHHVVLYSVSATFRSGKQTLNCLTLNTIRCGNHRLFVSESGVYLECTKSSDSKTERRVVGRTDSQSLTMDALNTLKYILDISDVRYIMFDIISISITTLEEDCDKVSLKFKQLYSIYPPEYSFDISFWIGNDFAVKEFYNMILKISHNLVREVKLIDSFVHPDTKRVSHCYSVIYQSLDRALSYDTAYHFYQFLRNICSNDLNIILR